jgi:hypothetical protein
MIVQDFLFRKCRRVFVGLPSELPIPNSFIKQSMQRDLQNKNDIDRGLVGRYNIFVMEVRPVFRNLWVFKG